ncbi:MAG: glutamate 5-kinase [archaeon]
MKRIIVKIGSACLTDKEGRLDDGQIKDYARQIAALMDSSSVILVTSAAIAAGMGETKLIQRPRRMPDLQALAAIGQSILMRRYHDEFIKHGIHTAQILLSDNDLSSRERFLNFRNTLDSLLKMRVLPIINENDTVANKEIKIVGDNDALAAAVACNVGADRLIMLSTVPGVYDREPTKPGAALIPEIKEITAEISRLSGKAKGFHSVGGIQSKISAARLCMASGVRMHLLDGRQTDSLLKVVRGDQIGTVFEPSTKKPRKDLWIKIAQPRGAIIIDKGAVSALQDKRSLLASGITGVEGVFPCGEVVEVRAPDGVIVGKGVPNYSSDDVIRIKGKRSDEIIKVLGSRPFPNVISRESFVLSQE